MSSAFEDNIRTPKKNIENHRLIVFPGKTTPSTRQNENILKRCIHPRQHTVFVLETQKARQRRGTGERESNARERRGKGEANARQRRVNGEAKAGQRRGKGVITRVQKSRCRILFSGRLQATPSHGREHFPMTGLRLFVVTTKNSGGLPPPWNPL